MPPKAQTTRTRSGRRTSSAYGRSEQEEPVVEAQVEPQPARAGGGRRRRNTGVTEQDFEPQMDVDTRMHGIEQRMDTMLDLMVDQQTRSRPSTRRASTSGGEIGGAGQTSERLVAFTRLKPPSFSGLDDRDPFYFLSELEKRFDLLRCDDEEMVSWAKFQLTELAGHWATSELESDLSWKQFKEAFVDRFIPESVRDERAQSFLELKQGPNMSVADYERRFDDLSRFAPEYVNTKEKKIKRFVSGLFAPIKKSLVSLKHKTFGSAVDNARKIEMISREEKAQEEVAKRSRFESGSSSSKSKFKNWQSGRRSTSDVQTGSSVPSQLPRSYSISTGQSHGGQPGHFSRADNVSGGQQGTSLPQSSYPVCQACGRPHPGTICYRASGACFGCGQTGHTVKYCPH